MSEIKVNKISPRTNCGTTTLGDSGDTFTIPSGVTISNLGTAAGFGGTGEISWDTTVKTNGTFTATSGVGYFLNTTAGTITVNLPAGTAGSSVAFADYAATWQTYSVSVVPNGTEKIGGTNANATLNTQGQSVTFVYIDGVQGWVNVIDSTSNVRGASFISASGGDSCGVDGNYKYHVFNNPGTFTVSCVAGCAANNVVDYLVVGGGAGGGAGVPNWTQAGGGGAGGYRTFVSNPTTSPKNAPAGITVSAQGYPIVVGGGGAGGLTPISCGENGVNGVDSSALGITATGGGGGGAYAPSQTANTGGSGGGGANASSTPNIVGAAGNTPVQNPSQGNTGGDANRAFVGPSNYQNFAGGGGGANAVGANGGPTCDPGTGGVGGAGEPNYITGSNVTYAGGGGGGGAGVNSSGGAIPGGGGAGGAGGGGYGATGGRSANCVTWTPGGGRCAAQNGDDNTGGGGGGGSANGDSATPEFGMGGGNGGSGVVIIRYKYQ